MRKAGTYFVACFLHICLVSAFAPRLYAQQSEVDVFFTPLEIVRQSQCAGAVDWDAPGIANLSGRQQELFRQAYDAAMIYDDATLQSLVTESANYRDLYGFISQLRSFVLSFGGLKFMYQQPFDRSIELHDSLAQRFENFDPDVIVSIVWCQPSANGGGVQQTGGFAYLSLVDGEWKFHAR